MRKADPMTVSEASHGALGGVDPQVDTGVEKAYSSKKVVKRGIGLKQTDMPACSLKDTIYQRIVEMICNGQLPPRVTFTEMSLIQHFQVSKSPIREALIQLCSEDVLRSIPRHGYQVIEINQKNIQDITQLRLYLELGNLPEVFNRMTPEILAELRAQNEQRHQPVEKKAVWDSWNRNTLFHMTLIELGGNAQVAKAMKSAIATCTRAYAQLFASRKAVIAPACHNNHDLIVDAFDRHDLFSAHEYLQKDILLMAKTLYADLPE